jgi:Na+/melibiose symporter-like transporter
MRLNFVREVAGNRNALLFVAVSLVAGVGGGIMSLSAVLWVWDLTGDSGMAALLGLAVFVPSLAGPAVGALVDRVPRRPLVIATPLALALLLLCLLTVHSRAQVPLLFGAMLGYGLSYVLLDAAESALLPASLPADLLAPVNGLRMSAQEGAKLIAPLAGAGLYTWLGGPVVALVAAALAGAVAVLYAVLRPAGVATSLDLTGRGRGRIRAGLAYLWRSRHLRGLTLIAATGAFASGFNTAAFYRVVTDDLSLPPRFVGVTASAQGAGSIVGGLVVGGLINRFGGPAVSRWGGLLFAGAVTLLLVPLWPVALLACGLIGIGLPWPLVVAYTAIQRDTPAGLLGRVSASAGTAIFGPIAAASPLGVLAVGVFGHRGTIAGSAVLVAAVAIAASRAAGRNHADSPRRYVDATPQGAQRPPRAAR